MRLFLALVANIVGLLATTIVPGITFRGNWVALLLAGIIFAFINAIIRPIAVILSIPFLIVTLGLFYFVLNGLLIYFASALIPGYQVSGLMPAILGGLVLMVVNWFLGALRRDAKDED
jgi:putative membrane protein